MGEYYGDPHRYDDIIGLPYQKSAKRPQMSLRDRAAQFAPFAALTGRRGAYFEEGGEAGDNEAGEEEEEGLSF